jgi:hypothetical protein
VLYASSAKPIKKPRVDDISIPSNNIEGKTS